MGQEQEPEPAYPLIYGSSRAVIASMHLFVLEVHSYSWYHCGVALSWVGGMEWVLGIFYELNLHMPKNTAFFNLSKISF